MDKVYKLPKIAFPEVSGDTVSFYSEYAGLPLKKCEVAFAATQSGTGDPSPVNVRPIVGVDSVSVVDSAADPEYYPVNKLIPIPAFQDGEGDPSPSNVRQILYGLSITRDDSTELEVYGGTLNVLSGELIITNAKVVYDGSSDEAWSEYSAYNGFRLINYYMKIGSGQTGVANWLNVVPVRSEFGLVLGVNNNTIFASHITDNIAGITDLESWKTYLSTHNLELVYPLAEPTTIQLSATELQRAKDALGIATATIDLDGTRYGGTVDFVSGVAHLTKKAVVFNENSAIRVYYQAYIKSDATACYLTDTDIYPSTSAGTKLGGLSDKTKGAASMIWANTGYVNRNAINYQNVYINIDNALLGITDYTQETPSTALEKFKAWLANNPVTVLVPVDLTVQLTPAQIETIAGTNTIFADTGDTTVQYIRVY